MEDHTTEFKRPNGDRVKIVVSIVGGMFVTTRYETRLWIKRKFQREWSVASESDFTPKEILDAKLAFWESIKPT